MIPYVLNTTLMCNNIKEISICSDNIFNPITRNGDTHVRANGLLVQRNHRIWVVRSRHVGLVGLVGLVGHCGHHVVDIDMYDIELYVCGFLLGDFLI